MISAALLAAVLAAPVTVAAYLLDSAGAAGLQQLAATTTTETDTPATPPATPLVIGTLYTSGRVIVDWNAIQIPVENSTYPYAGGELISTTARAMGILRLGDRGTIFICSGSQVRLSREPSGRYSLDVLKGSSRFVFDSQTPFQVRANETVITPDEGVGGTGGGPEKLAYSGEVEARPDGGCELCDLRGSLDVTTSDPATGRASILVMAGEILSVLAPESTATGDGETGSPFARIQIPPELFSNMLAGAGTGVGGRGIGYLCKCRKLKEYAHAVERILAETPTAVPEAIPIDLLPDVTPPVAPPGIPGLELVETGPPPPFVAGLTPPGDSPGPAEPLPVVVSPPLVPGVVIGGGGVVTGGGDVVSPS